LGHERASVTIEIMGYEYAFTGDYRDLPVAPPSTTSVAEIDLRKKGFVSSVRNQGQCGSDWAFSAIGATEGWAAAIAGKGLPTLSEQQLVDCAGGFNTMGCSGGSPAAAFSYIIQDGICLNSDYPYTARKATCRSCPSVLKLSRVIRIPVGDEQTLAARVTKQPVSVVLNGNWFNEYKEGVADPGCKGAKAPEFAAALIVGFGQTNSADPATAYWLVKNSVGTGWGEKGYFRIVRGQNKCGIADFATVPQ
jgi:C1A family cysteine protease